VFYAVELCCRPLLQESILVQLQKDGLSDFRLLLGRSATKDVEADVEPAIDIGMDDSGTCRKAPAGAFVLKRFGLGRGSILIRASRACQHLPNMVWATLTTDVNGVYTSPPAIPRENIC